MTLPACNSFIVRIETGVIVFFMTAVNSESSLLYSVAIRPSPMPAAKISVLLRWDWDNSIMDYYLL